MCTRLQKSHIANYVIVQMNPANHTFMSYLLKIHFNIILSTICNCRKCSRLKYVREYKLLLVRYVSVYDAS
jgi:hypothetical protein